MNSPILVTSWYLFTNIEEQSLSLLANEISVFAAAHKIGGLVLVAQEGINGTVAGESFAIAIFKDFIAQTFSRNSTGENTISWKDSPANKQPFKRFKVDIRPEIVALKWEAVGEIIPEQNGHLTPQQWDEFIAANPDTTILDTRNHYETRLGMFESAIDPKIDTFQELPEYLAKSDLPRDKPLLMYCTGGIRCEKATVAAKQLGFQKVYQLSGGILGYLEQFPSRSFNGECFVFDSRVAVDQQLVPSTRYQLCPHCGDPADRSTGIVECGYCGRQGCVCDKCLKSAHLKACSKNCAHHLKRHLNRLSTPAAESAVGNSSDSN